MCCIWNRSDESDAEIDDQEINRILIVTQTPPAFRKHPGGDRTGDFLPRAKMTAELAKVINDGLYYYEKDLWYDEDTKVSHKITFEKVKISSFNSMTFSSGCSQTNVLVNFVGTTINVSHNLFGMFLWKNNNSI